MPLLTCQTAANLEKQNNYPNRFFKFHSLHGFTFASSLLRRLQFVVTQKNLGEAVLRWPHRSTWLDGLIPYATKTHVQPFVV